MQSAESKIIKSLIIYIIVFMIIICIVGSVSTYFHSNISNINSNLDSNSEVTKLNLYLLKIVKQDGVFIKKYGLVNNDDLNSYYITFENKNGITNTFIKIDNILYFNKIKLCENVEKFVIDVDNQVKESVYVSVDILGKTYDLQYVIN